jgi:hypothetical protein
VDGLVLDPDIRAGLTEQLDAVATHVRAAAVRALS